MPISSEQNADGSAGGNGWRGWPAEAAGLAFLAALLGYFLAVSWRKWPDPIIDSGPQWYGAWRVAEGGMLFHEVGWTYGPLSAYGNGLLFKFFGANLSVLFAANLVVYGGILALAYLAFRRAWGRLGAWAAGAVFISVFSFSHLTSVGNYNYAAPYAHEATHGMLLMLLTLFAAAGWRRGRSGPLAFLLGTCGGLAAVLKPEFMLAAGALGLGALALRAAQREAVSGREAALLAAGVAWPTLAFTLVFGASEPFPQALAHACNAWWLVVVRPIGATGFAAGQSRFAGFDQPLAHGWLALKSCMGAMAVIGGTWAAGWFVQRPTAAIRILAVAGLGGLVFFVRLDGGWFHVGECFPLLTAMAFVFYGLRLHAQWRGTGRLETATVLQWLLTLLAGAMLARMALFGRVYHFGFFQAALGGMVIAAIMVAEVPLWTGPGRMGRAVCAGGGVLVLTLACSAIAARSNAIRAGQTQAVGAGPNLFYAFDREIDTTGALVDWVVKRLAGAPAGASLLVLPDGLSINFLTRHVSPLPDVWAAEMDQTLVEQVRNAPPDYVALISLDLSEHGIQHYGEPGNPGYQLLAWVAENYETEASWGHPFSGTRLKGASVWHRKMKGGANRP